MRELSQDCNGVRGILIINFSANGRRGLILNKVLERVIKLIHVRTQSQLADLLTKALSHKQFSELLSKMGLINIYQPTVHLKGEYQD